MAVVCGICCALAGLIRTGTSSITDRKWVWMASHIIYALECACRLLLLHVADVCGGDTIWLLNGASGGLGDDPTCLAHDRT